MEGKGVLFKRFANIDVFDIEVKEKNQEKFVEIVSSLEPTFGGINLEDIKAPECFYIEEELIKKMNIPVFHDDQHGTSIIVGAALLNALEIADKNLSRVKIIFSGAGAAAISCATILIELGAKKENIYMFDSEGLIAERRISTLNKYKAQFMQNKELTLVEAFVNADVFIGLSKANMVTKEMVKTMAQKPIIFAMANPNPEITYSDAKEAVPEAIVATGRSDFPNQVNNVLGFPFIFRGSLDVQASKVNMQMKLATVKALAKLAHKNVPSTVVKAYGKEFNFGPEYIIPKPFDPRVLYHVAPAVAKAAMESGVARKNIDIKEYTKELKVISRKLAKGKF